MTTKEFKALKVGDRFKINDYPEVFTVSVEWKRGRYLTAVTSALRSDRVFWLYYACNLQKVSPE